MYQVYYEKGEECIAKCFLEVNKCYSLRNKIKFKAPFLNKESEKITFRYQGARLWNEIPHCLRN